MPGINQETLQNNNLPASYVAIPFDILFETHPKEAPIYRFTKFKQPDRLFPIMKPSKK